MSNKNVKCFIGYILVFYRYFKLCLPEQGLPNRSSDKMVKSRSRVQSFWTGPYLQNSPYTTYSTTLKVSESFLTNISHKQTINPVLI